MDDEEVDHILKAFLGNTVFLALLNLILKIPNQNIIIKMIALSYFFSCSVISFKY